MKMKEGIASGSEKKNSVAETVEPKLFETCGAGVEIIFLINIYCSQFEG